jgi:hypothetical protein
MKRGFGNNMNKSKLFNKLELLSNKLCKELGIVIKPVKTKEEIINGKNFSAILFTKNKNNTGKE